MFFGIHLADTFEGLPALDEAWETVRLKRGEAGRVRQEISESLDRQERIITKLLRYLGTEGPEADLRVRYAKVIDGLQDRIEAAEGRLAAAEEEHETAREAALAALDKLAIPNFGLPG